jgi:thiamine-monophosphate kinase
VSFRDENEFVKWLRRRWPERAPGLELGIGDDAAILRTPRDRDLVLTSDLSIENVHFRLDLHPPRTIGHRALARSLSDLAAMGAIPRFALLSLAFPQRTERSWIAAFYEGFGGLAEQFGVKLIGGDTSVTHDGLLIADLIAVGEVDRGHALRRRGANPGDRLFVTGQLGFAALGLALLKRGAPANVTRGRVRGAHRAALRAHLYPEPRCAIGRYLATHRMASAAIDISDGFARDLGRLCESSACGARIWQDCLPLIAPVAMRSRDRASASRKTVALEFDPLDFGLHGGEDYELLFTVPPSKYSRVPRSIAAIKIHEIGEITADRTLRVISPDETESVLEPRGYDHFRNLQGP